MEKENLKELLQEKGHELLNLKSVEPEQSPVTIPSPRPNNNLCKTLVLFVSYDVVNSTAYKDQDADWPNLLLGMFHEIEKSFDSFEANSLCTVDLWRIIGDEIIFTVEVRNKDTIIKFIQHANATLLTINERHRKSKFQGYPLFLEHRNISSHILLKATAWLSIVNRSEEPLRYRLEKSESIYMQYKNNTKNWFREYYGNDIDAGFRLEEYSRSNRMTLSFELAYFLAGSDARKYLHIVSYEQLKGIWRNRLYPIIWYHCPQKVTGDLRKDFENSFAYDAAMNDPLIQNYMEIRQNIFYNNPLHPLPANMYDVTVETMRKIAKDVKLEDKLQKMEDIFANPPSMHNLVNSAFMKVDCVAVCYKIDDNKIPEILILKTIAQTNQDSSKWCFGSAAAHVGESVTNALIKGYDNDISLQIEPLIYDENDTVKQVGEDETDNITDPIPIALFERSDERSNGSQRKGIICVAKIINDNEIAKRMGTLYKEFRYISEQKIESGIETLLGEDDKVNNFARTARLAFELINRYENSARKP